MQTTELKFQSLLSWMTLTGTLDHQDPNNRVLFQSLLSWMTLTGTIVIMLSFVAISWFQSLLSWMTLTGSGTSSGL